jgi:hypothetical protein
LDWTGLIARLQEGAQHIDNGRKWQNTDGLEREGRVIYNNGLSIALAAFKEAQTSAPENLELLIVAEQAFVTQELQFCASTDTDAISSLSGAIQSIEEGLLALKVLETGSTYRAVDQCLPHRTECRYNGMPKDAFHFACAGHKTRLKNILKSPGINLTEKVLLKQRCSNIVTAQSVYLKKQKEILGVDKK